MSRRLLIAVMAGVLLWQTPALASLAIGDRQQAATELTAGPQFFEYGSGEPVVVGQPTAWDGFVLDGLQIDETTGHLVLGRAGDVAPSDDPWLDGPSSSRACEPEPATGVRALLLDMQAEVEAGRMRPDLADIRAYDIEGGSPVRFRVDAPIAETDPGAIVVETAGPATVCAYWGSATAESVADPTLRGPVIPDGGWSWSIWNDAGDGKSLDLVDWSVPSATGQITSGSVPADVCNQCANEVVGFLTPAVTGMYRLFLSADDVGRLELGPAADRLVIGDPPVIGAPVFDPQTLTTIVSLDTATAADDFADPSQVSVDIELVAGEVYPIRARSKDLEAGDHLQIAWALDGDAPVLLPTEVIADVDGEAGSLTHRRFDLVETADRTGPPDSTVRIEASQNDPGTCDECAHAISGYVVVAESGDYRFWISSDDEGTLLLSTEGDPSAATRVAWLTNYTGVDNWTADPSQQSAPIALVAGQTIWIEAHNRDRGGPDHLQVGWSRVDPPELSSPGLDPELIPAPLLSEAAPVEAPLPTVALGPVQGQPATSGTFQSAPIDTSAGGSNVFGLVLADIAGDDQAGQVDVVIEFASDPGGPWTPPAPFVKGAPVPLSSDGLRWFRVGGTMSGADSSIAGLGVERDLTEASSVDATSTVVVPGAGDHHLLRVRGSIGSPASATVDPSSAAAVDIWLAGAADPTRRTTLPFESASSHHLGVSVTAGAGPTSATSRWLAVDGLGVTVVHELVVVVEGA